MTRLVSVYRNILLALLFILFINSRTISQNIYFSNSYNYNNFSPALAVIRIDSNYIFSGVTFDSVNNTTSIYVAKTDYLGNLLFWKTISDQNKSYWAGRTGSLVSLNDNGFAIAGNVVSSTRNNAILYRFDQNGDTLWTTQYPDTLSNSETQFWNCNTTQDNGFILVGYHPIESFHTNILLIKADSLGNEIWRKEYGNYGWVKHGYSVIQTPDNGYAVGYYQYVVNQDTTGDPVVMKVDSLGNFEWEVNLGGPREDFTTQICLGADSSIIAGTSISDSVIQDNHFNRVKIFKISPSGDIIWGKTYGEIELDNNLYSIYPDHENGFIACGKRDNYFPPGPYWNEYGWLLKISDEGDSIWYREYQYYKGGEDNYNRLHDLCLTENNGYLMAGKVFTWFDPTTAWLIKVDSFGCDSPGCQSVYINEQQGISDETLLIYPNPAITEVQINIQGYISDKQYSILLYDIYGRQKDEIVIPKGDGSIRIDVSTYSSGIYIAIVRNIETRQGQGKFIIR